MHANKKIVFRLATLAIVCGGANAAVVYDPVEWKISEGGNGHRYRAVFESNRMTWTDAKAMAESLGGHLATLTSAAEADFVFTKVARAEQWWIDGGPWLGGYQDTSAPDYSEPRGGWRWVTGEAWSFTNWGGGEPNNYGGLRCICTTLTQVDRPSLSGTTSPMAVPSEVSSWKCPQSPHPAPRSPSR